MRVRAGIVVTGTEVLTGRVADRNGPWLAEQLRDIGVDVGHVVVVGDRPDDLVAALEFLAGSGVPLVITTGGLGPTADDLTAEVVGRFQGRPAELDPELEPVGTAPGLVVPPAGGREGPVVVVLPGPPPELRGMWSAALAAEPVRRALAGSRELRQETVRLWRTLEAQLAATLRETGPGLDGLEITTCMREGELEIVTRFAPDAQPAYDRLLTALTVRHGDALFSTGPSLDDLVGAALAGGHTIATAESCTGGLLAARLTARPGSSAYVVGGVTAYANSAKEQLVGVPAELLERHGAVSAQVARALADGARTRFGAGIGVGITGVAGPGGGTVEKPVGTVHLCVAAPSDVLARSLHLPGSRAAVRERSVTMAMHLLRELLLGGPPA